MIELHDQTIFPTSEILKRKPFNARGTSIAIEDQNLTTFPAEIKLLLDKPYPVNEIRTTHLSDSIKRRNSSSYLGPVRVCTTSRIPAIPTKTRWISHRKNRDLGSLYWRFYAAVALVFADFVPLASRIQWTRSFAAVRNKLQVADE